jgi:hypothetical protein
MEKENVADRFNALPDREQLLQWQGLPSLVRWNHASRKASLKIGKAETQAKAEKQAAPSWKRRAAESYFGKTKHNRIAHSKAKLIDASEAEFIRSWSKDACCTIKAGKSTDWCPGNLIQEAGGIRSAPKDSQM